MHDKLELIIGGGNVRRFHAKSVITEETVGHHSFLVAWVCALLWGEDTTPPLRTVLILAALQHDLPECRTGDIPGPAKRILNIGGQFTDYERTILAEHGHFDYSQILSEREQRVLSFADYAAGALHCIHERRLGNRNLVNSYTNYQRYMNAYAPLTIPELDLLHLLDAQWEALP